VAGRIGYRARRFALALAFSVLTRPGRRAANLEANDTSVQARAAEAVKLYRPVPSTCRRYDLRAPFRQPRPPLWVGAMQTCDGVLGPAEQDMNIACVGRLRGSR